MKAIFSKSLGLFSNTLKCIIVTQKMNVAQTVTKRVKQILQAKGIHVSWNQILVNVRG